MNDLDIFSGPRTTRPETNAPATSTRPAERTRSCGPRWTASCSRTGRSAEAFSTNRRQVALGTAIGDAGRRHSGEDGHRRLQAVQKIGGAASGWFSWPSSCDPVKRRVALKVVKPAWTAREVVARFEARAPGPRPDGPSEYRQGLRRRSPPGRAALLRDGAGAGRPHHGRTATSNSLRIDERLELFIAVCQAVQHAHQKGSSTATSSPPTSW